MFSLCFLVSYALHICTHILYAVQQIVLARLKPWAGQKKFFFFFKQAHCLRAQRWVCCLVPLLGNFWETRVFTRSVKCFGFHVDNRSKTACSYRSKVGVETLLSIRYRTTISTGRVSQRCHLPLQAGNPAVLTYVIRQTNMMIMRVRDNGDCDIDSHSDCDQEHTSLHSGQVHKRSVTPNKCRRV